MTENNVARALAALSLTRWCHTVLEYSGPDMVKVGFCMDFPTKRVHADTSCTAANPGAMPEHFRHLWILRSQHCCHLVHGSHNGGSFSVLKRWYSAHPAYLNVIAINNRQYIQPTALPHKHYILLSYTNTSALFNEMSRWLPTAIILLHQRRPNAQS